MFRQPARAAKLRLGLVALALTSLSPLATQAQQTEAELVHRRDSLRPLLDAATTDLAAYKARKVESDRAHAAATAVVDTINVGMVTIVTPTDQVEIARALFQEAWDEHFSEIQYSPTLESAVFSFQWSNERVPIYVESNARVVEMNRWTRRSRVKDEIGSVIGSTISFDLQSASTKVGRWVAGDPFQYVDPERTYRTVATTESQVTRACLAGDTEACRQAVGLDANRDFGQLETWYTPAERRALVVRSSFYAWTRLSGGQWRQCLNGQLLEACDALLSRYERDWTPLPGAVRATLLAYALERGGEGAWKRLLEDPERQASDALAYASAMPIDDLLVGWQRWLVEHRPQTYEHVFPKGGLALLWSLFFGALAMRSTRWRLG